MYLSIKTTLEIVVPGKSFIQRTLKQFDFMEVIKALTTAATFYIEETYFKFKYSVFQICLM